MWEVNDEETSQWPAESYEEDSPHSSVFLTISKRDVGKVIGRGGAKINEFRAETGCAIRITDNYDDATVQIDSQDREKSLQAKKMIEDFLQRDRKKVFDETKIADDESKSEASAYHEKVEEYNRHVHDEEFWNERLEKIKEEELSKWAAFEPVRLGFYHEHPEITAMTDDEVEEFRERNSNIFVSNLGEDANEPIAKPTAQFKHAFEPYPEILSQLEGAFEKPSPIQCQMWPLILKGHDVIGVAQTGTGKTLAFLLPALIHIDNQLTPRENRNGPTCLVLTPTRELALQIHKEVRTYKYKGIKSACLYGGGDRRLQVNQVRAGVEIIIATPGRLNDLVSFGELRLDDITYFVLDEADRMLDMGFEPQISMILQFIRPKRQTIMTSATWPALVQKLAVHYMTKPLQVNVGSLDLSAAKSVHQSFLLVEKEEKFQRLSDYLATLGESDRTIVFCKRKRTVDEVAKLLGEKNIRVAIIHGDLPQSDRMSSLKKLKEGHVEILVATDLASRGLDVKDVTTVVNFDFPQSVDDYVHRIGRTGRAGRTGQSYTLFTQKDAEHAKTLCQLLADAQQEIPEWLSQIQPQADPP